MEPCLGQLLIINYLYKEHKVYGYVDIDAFKCRPKSHTHVIINNKPETELNFILQQSTGLI